MPQTSGEWIWWFYGSVIVAIIVNLVSFYIQPSTDRWLKSATKHDLLLSKLLGVKTQSKHTDKEIHERRQEETAMPDGIRGIANPQQNIIGFLKAFFLY